MHVIVSVAQIRFVRQFFLFLGSIVFLGGIARAEESKPFFFIQLSDPQFGMNSQNADLQQETANFEFAIVTANRLKPAFVIITGDLVNKAGDKSQVEEYLRIAAKLDRSIPLYQMPGNHDVGNAPTPESIAAYTARFGPDHYTFRRGSLLGVVLNSNLFRSPEGVRSQAQQQESWLKSELEKATREGVPHVVVFQHHPWFVKKVDEPDQYDNLPRRERRRYLDLFREHGVTHVLAGHYHANSIGRYEGIEMVTTGAIGKPLRHDVSGMRIVIVRETGIEHRFYHLGEIPNQIDMTRPKKTVSQAVAPLVTHLATRLESLAAARYPNGRALPAALGDLAEGQDSAQGTVPLPALRGKGPSVVARMLYEVEAP
jgi:serine/threonine-protein phosphatase CPPED1